MVSIYIEGVADMNRESFLLAPIFRDGIILQRNCSNEIYGMEMVEKEVVVSFLGAEYRGKVRDNYFSITLPPTSFGGPYSIRVSGSKEQVIEDVYFGDVYLLAGQSNMELPIKRVLDVSYEEIKNTHEPLIRQYMIPASYNFKEPDVFMGESSWKLAMDEDIYDFSALGYFFAKEIKDKYQIPVGLILTAVGGSSIEAWMSPDTLDSFGEYRGEIEKFYDLEYFHSHMNKQQQKANRWMEEIAEGENISLSDYKTWDTVTLPAFTWEFGYEDFSGSIYFVKDVYLDEEQIRDNAYLYMGAIIDSDKIYINGVLIGETGYRYPPRKYTIPMGVLGQGMNRITVRIVVNNRKGGMIKGKPYYLSYEGEKISLEGEWHYKVGYQASKTIPPVLFPPSLPTGLYHTRVVPLSKVSVKGMLWYQGESNTYNAGEYGDKFKAMIADIRKQYPTLPVVYTQLSNYKEPLGTEEDSGWGMLRDQQRQCLSIPDTRMIVTFDKGEDNDIHPQNKKELGIRMALAARNLIYKEDIVFSGPLPIRAKRTRQWDDNHTNDERMQEGDREDNGYSRVISDNDGDNLSSVWGVKIEFNYLENSLTETRLSGFELAGEDGNFYPALALRKGDRVYVESNTIPIPQKVRYAWCDNPTIDFYNDAGLPASGFSLEVED